MDLLDSSSVRKVDVTQEFWNFYFLTVSSPTNFFLTDVGLKVPLVFLMVAVRLVFSVPAAINTNWKSRPWLMKNSLEENKRFLGVR